MKKNMFILINNQPVNLEKIDSISKVITVDVDFVDEAYRKTGCAFVNTDRHNRTLLEYYGYSEQRKPAETFHCFTLHAENRDIYSKQYSTSTDAGNALIQLLIRINNIYTMPSQDVSITI